MPKQVFFRGLAQYTEAEAEKLRNFTSQKPVKREVVSENSVLREIFAPDPFTGNPNSDLYFQLGADPKLKEYIASELQSFQANMLKTQDIDEALTTTKSRFESVQDYANRLRDYVSKQEKVK